MITYGELETRDMLFADDVPWDNIYIVTEATNRGTTTLVSWIHYDSSTGVFEQISGSYASAVPIRWAREVRCGR